MKTPPQNSKTPQRVSTHAPFFNKENNSLTPSLENTEQPFFKVDDPIIQMQRRGGRRQRRPRVTELSLYAAQYSRNYQNDADEIAALNYRSTHGTYDPEDPNQTWWPTSIDFRASASSQGGLVQGVNTMSQMVSIIRRRRNLSEVRLFTHGATNEIQFGRGGSFTMADIGSLPDLSGSFGDGGRIIFYACNSGRSTTRYDNDFFQQIANQVRVEICGFTTGVRYHLGWNAQNEITERGLNNNRTPICVSPQ